MGFRKITIVLVDHYHLVNWRSPPKSKIVTSALSNCYIRKRHRSWYLSFGWYLIDIIRPVPFSCGHRKWHNENGCMDLHSKMTTMYAVYADGYDVPSRHQKFLNSSWTVVLIPTDGFGVNRIYTNESDLTRRISSILEQYWVISTTLPGPVRAPSSYLIQTVQWLWITKFLKMSGHPHWTVKIDYKIFRIWSNRPSNVVLKSSISARKRNEF